MTQKSEFIECVARACFEVNRAWCLATGDTSQPAWDDAPEWQRASTCAGAERVLDGSITRPDQSHESWLDQKVREGWVFGAVKDPEAKTHPCMLPYDELPLAQRLKDTLFLTTALAMGRAAGYLP